MNTQEEKTMEFMLLFTERSGAPRGGPDRMTEMTKFARELIRQKKLRRGAPLAGEAESVWVRVREGKALVSDGPFAESKEVLGGFCIIEVASRAEAIEIARRAPHARHGKVEVHELNGRYTFSQPEKGTPFLLAFRMEPGLTDPDGSKMREMLAYGEELVSAGKHFETAPLKQDAVPARIETRGGETLVTDGPFAEAKEAVGGYSLVYVTDRAEAVEIAKRFPHARWGPVEVREILFFDPV